MSTLGLALGVVNDGGYRLRRECVEGWELKLNFSNIWGRGCYLDLGGDCDHVTDRLAAFVLGRFEEFGYLFLAMVVEVVYDVADGPYFEICEFWNNGGAIESVWIDLGGPNDLLCFEPIGASVVFTIESGP